MIDESLRALANKDRRQLLQELVDRDEDDEIPVPEAVVQGDEDRSTVRIEFHHRHLPKLEKLGLVDWNRESDVITKGANFETVRQLIEAVEKVEQSLEDES